MPPKARDVIARASEEFGVPMVDLIGPKKRRYRQAVEARKAIIRELYDPETRRRTNPATFQWGASAIARILQCDHTTVIHAATRMGLRS